MTDKLLPCPFCGGKAKLEQMSFSSGTPFWLALYEYRVQCGRCYISTPKWRTKKTAVKRWNQRRLAVSEG